MFWYSFTNNLHKIQTSSHPESEVSINPVTDCHKGWYILTAHGSLETQDKNTHQSEIKTKKFNQNNNTQ